MSRNPWRVPIAAMIGVVVLMAKIASPEVCYVENPFADARALAGDSHPPSGYSDRKPQIAAARAV